jgi:hypothetical protein
VAAEKLRRRVDDDIGAPFDRAAQIRGGEGVVYDQRQLVIVCDRRHRLDVQYVAGWVADRLREEREVPSSPRLQLDLRGGEIRTIVWATGFRPDYSWLQVPVLDGKGNLRHDGGVLESPGLYALGLPVLRRRNSTFIHGIEDDAREVINHLAGHLAANARRPLRSAGTASSFDRVEFV